MTTRRHLLLAAAAAPGIPLMTSAAPPTTPLRRGVNLTTWMQLDQRQHYDAYDFATIHEAGFDHVRVCVDFEMLGWSPSAPKKIPGIARLDAAIAMAQDAGLTTILDNHASQELVAAIEKDATVVAAIETLWRVLAHRYAKVPRQDLVFELFNEPQYYGAMSGRWPGAQRRLLTAVQDEASALRVLCTGSQGSRLETLDEVIPEANVVGNFHYYQPYIVTHQGAEWGFEDTAIPFLHKVPYPSSLVKSRPPEVLPKISQRAGLRAAYHYAWEGWNAARIAGEIAVAGQWKLRTGLPMMCTEFGVYRRDALPETRWRWLADVRTALEAQGIGWTVWDYSDTFGITTIDGPSYVTDDGALMPNAPDARRRFIPEALVALGLKGAAT